MGYYRSARHRDLLASLVGDSLDEIADRVLDMEDEAEAAGKEMDDLEKRVAELEAEVETLEGKLAEFVGSDA